MERTFSNPVFNDVCTVIKTAEETHGDYSEFEVSLGPQGGNPTHRHSAFSETFTCLEGILGVKLNGKHVYLKPGEQITAKPGVAHCFFNPTDERTRFHLVLCPGHTGMENMLRIIYGLARDGKTDKKGLPGLVTLAVLSEMSNTTLTGLMGLLTPLFKWLAAYGEKKGIAKELLERYCR